MAMTKSTPASRWNEMWASGDLDFITDQQRHHRASCDGETLTSIAALPAEAPTLTPVTMSRLLARDEEQILVCPASVLRSGECCRSSTLDCPSRSEPVPAGASSSSVLVAAPSMHSIS